MESLLEWRRKSEFSKDEDWIFASPFSAGEKPYFQTEVRKKVFSAAQRAGIAHLLRGGANQDSSTLLPIKAGDDQCASGVIKDLMSHADIRTTFDEYGNGLPPRCVKQTAKSCEWFYAS